VTVSTDDLIRRYQAGQTGLFEALYDRYKDYVYRVAYSLTHHPQESEEVVQEAFLDVLRALPRYRVEGRARFETWLYTVTRNRCRMRWRRKRLPIAEWDEVGEQIAQLPDERPDHDPEHVAQQGEARKAIWQSVGRLKVIYREVVLLRYGQSLSYDEIAQALQINIGTVKSRLNTAHRKLREIMEGGDAGGAGGRRGKRGRATLVLLWLWELLAVCRPSPSGRVAWVTRAFAPA